MGGKVANLQKSRPGLLWKTAAGRMSDVELGQRQRDILDAHLESVQDWAPLCLSIGTGIVCSSEGHDPCRTVQESRPCVQEFLDGVLAASYLFPWLDLSWRWSRLSRSFLRNPWSKNQVQLDCAALEC